MKELLKQHGADLQKRFSSKGITNITVLVSDDGIRIVQPKLVCGVVFYVCVHFTDYECWAGILRPRRDQVRAMLNAWVSRNATGNYTVKKAKLEYPT